MIWLASGLIIVFIGGGLARACGEYL